MKKITISAAALLLTLGMKSQQDAQYNLYQFNQMVINPAFAGSRDGLSTIAAIRQQWAGVDGAPRTACMSIHGPILSKNVGLGLTVTNDVMGPRNVISAYGNAAYILKVSNKSRLAFGLNAGYNHYQFNFTKITFENTETIPVEYLSTQNKGTLDINSGLYLRTPGFFAGLSVTHINTPRIYTYEAKVGNGQFSYRLKTHLFLTLGKSFIINNKLVFAPTILLKQVNTTAGIDTKLNTGLDVNLNFFINNKLWLGAFYRNGYGPGALIQYYITNSFRVAYSYDTGLDGANRLGSSHEIMFGYDFAAKTKAKMVNPRFL